MALTWKKLAYEEDVVLKSLFDAQSILAAVSDDTPAAVTVAEQTIIGRITGGNIDDLSATQVRTLINVEDGADVTDATNVASAGAVMESDYAAKGDLIVGTGVGTAAVLTVGATNGHAIVVDSTTATGLNYAATGTGDFKADGTVAMTGNLDFAEKQAVDMIIHTVANATARDALANPTVGKLAFQTDTLAAYICTSAA